MNVKGTLHPSSIRVFGSRLVTNVRQLEGLLYSGSGTQLDTRLIERLNECLCLNAIQLETVSTVPCLMLHVAEGELLSDLLKVTRAQLCSPDISLTYFTQHRWAMLL